MREIPKHFFEEGKLKAFDEKFPTYMPKFIFYKLKKSIKENEHVCKLYRVQGTSIVAVVPYERYLLTLQEILTTFVNEEEFELAGEVRDLIVDFQVNQVIRESQVRPDE